jgi:hypothetical protein
MARKLSRQFSQPSIAIIEDEDRKTERFRYDRGVL